tara:strand:- start:808 stop:2022 length:1215 start_codon:yes stop_codon:yes gene_type:complete
MSFFGGNLLWNVASQAASSFIDNFDENEVAIVYSVILDESHPEIKSGRSTLADIGSIQCRLMSSIQNNELIIAKPLDSTVTILPIRNQTVFVQKFGSNYVYTQIAKGSSPNTSSPTNAISSLFPGKQKVKSGNTGKKYSNVSNTGITRKDSNSINDLDGYGDYFTAEEGIHKLKLYEGDVLFQSRFGQSIRLSGYNNSENVFSPTLILRSGESPENRKLPEESLVEENVNEDGNIIFLGSGEKILEYTLPIENKKESFSKYPSELKGNQILLNSDRIILSAKSQEMIFASKLDMGFITDNQFSIDASRGIDITVDDEIDINTKDFNFNLNIGNGIIKLGTDGTLEKAPKGETLVKLLGELIDLISKQIYVTPAGPTSLGPTNVALFSTLKNKLKSMLSSNVQLK